MADREPAFLLAEFATPEPMLAAARAMREAGWTVEIHAPFPVEGMADALGFAERRVPRAFLVGGVLGTLAAFALQVYASLAYPIVVGGRPLVAVPAFAMIAFELLVLCAVLAGIGTMLASNRLPRLHHPLFDAERFALSSDDRFFVSAEIAEGREEEARDAFARHRPVSLARVGGAPA